jgi:hypothetical protein
MKKIFIVTIAGFFVYSFFANKNVRNGVIEEITNIENKLNEAGQDIALTETEKYFNEVVTNTEYDQNNHTISKWEKDVKIFVKGAKKQDLMIELNSIVSELNGLINPIDIKFVNKESDANLVLFFGSPEGFTKLYPNLKPYMEENWGLFEIFGSEEITSGRVFVDIVRNKSLTGQKHVLREELTQSLGFCNDSYSYPESIFYQDWTETTEYAQIDKEIIKMLYNK